MNAFSRQNPLSDILIVEDSATQAAQLVHLLEQHGYAVKVARNGREALAILEETTPLLVITDVVMPEMDGYGLCAAIKANPRWKQIPVMLVTTLSDAVDVIRGLECGADNFIRKPYEERYLLSRIDYLLMNQALRKNQRMHIGVEITLGNERHFINSDRQQILDLLISTYEQAVQINNELKEREGDLNQANRVLQGLYRIAEGLNQAGSEEEVAELVLERALDLPGIESGWIFLRDAETGALRLAAVRNPPPAMEEARAFDGDCACLRLFREGALDSVTNILECQRLKEAEGDTAGLHCHATVPLWLGDRTLGLMNLVGPDAGLFREEELRTLYNIGNQVAVALDRNRLHENLEKLVRERTAKIGAEIAERRRVEEQLRHSEERYRLLFDRNPYPTWVYDTETLAFLAVNEAAVKHYGWSREEFLGMSIMDIRPPEDVPRLMQSLREEPMAQEPRAFGGFRHQTKAGKVIEVEISSSQIEIAGHHAELVLAMDVTERRLLEQQFLRAQRMESIGTLAGGIAHDLNNLLMPMMMGVALLRRDRLSEASLRALDNIERSARRGKDLVSQVLSFARGVEGSRVPVNIGDLLAEIRLIVESTFPKNLSFDVDVPPDICVIEGDPTQLHQLLLNLCVNARDAMPRGGRIRAAARNVEIDEQYALMHRGLAAGTYVMVEIADEGTGIPQQIIDRIFEPFFTTKELGLGTGLGLSTVAAITRSHGGIVNVYSEPGKGSTFKVYLPARRAEVSAERAEETADALPRGNGELVLVVDDEASVLSITQQTLEAFGYRVMTAEDGAQAIGMYAMHRDDIDVVITDMMMPVMDGPALVAALVRVDPGVRIIASSGLGDDGRVDRAAHAGVTHFLQKPYSAASILSVLASLLGRN